MTRQSPRSKLGALALSAAALGALAIWLPLAASAADSKGGRDTLVPVGPHSSGFGEFTDGRANKMRRIFGQPDNADRDQFTCTSALAVPRDPRRVRALRHRHGQPVP